MDDTLNIRMLGENLGQSLLVGNIDLVELWPLPTEKLYAIKGDLRGVVEAVDDDNFVAMLEEGKSREGTNVSSASARVYISIYLIEFVRSWEEVGAEAGRGRWGQKLQLPRGGRGLLLTL